MRNGKKENAMSTTKTDTSVKNLQRLARVAAEMRAAGNEAGCQAVLAAIYRALGVA